MLVHNFFGVLVNIYHDLWSWCISMINQSKWVSGSCHWLCSSSQDLITANIQKGCFNRLVYTVHVFNASFHSSLQRKTQAIKLPSLSRFFWSHRNLNSILTHWPPDHQSGTFNLANKETGEERKENWASAFKRGVCLTRPGCLLQNEENWNICSQVPRSGTSLTRWSTLVTASLG